MNSRTTPYDTDGRFLELAPNATDDGWHTRRVSPEGIRSSGQYYRDWSRAFRNLSDRAKHTGCEIDWDSLTIPAGKRWVAHRETKGGHEREFLTTPEALAEYKRRALQHYAGFDDTDKVLELIKAGNLQAAWTLANEDEDDEKELYATWFGQHHIDEVDLMVPFKDLPPVIQHSIRICHQP